MATPNQTRNVLLISLSFFFIFAGFSAAQQYLTVFLERTGHGKVALISLLLLYGTFLLAGTAVAKIIPLLGGLKRTVCIGSCIYALFIAGIAVGDPALLLISSFVMGIGAAFLWVSAGQIIADSSSNETAGRHFSYQMAAQFLGSIAGLAAGAYLLKTAGFANMYFSLAGIAGVGALLLLFVRPMKEDVDDRPFKFIFLIDRRMLAFFPLLFGLYFLAGQSFTAMNTIVVQTLGIASLAFIAGIFKGGNMAGSLLGGLVADMWKKSAALIINVVLACAGIALFVISQSFIPIFIGSTLMGISLAAAYPICLAWLKERLQPDEYIYALGVFFVYTNAGTIAAIFANMWLSAGVSFLPGIISLLLAIPGILLFSKLTAR